jgi:hypothetical protein
MTIPRAEELRQRIRIINVTEPFIEGGEGTEVSTHARARARIYAEGGSMEGNTLEDQIATQTYEVTMRYIKGVTAFQQIVWGSKRLVMTDVPVNWSQANRWLVFHARETTLHNVAV